MQIRQSSWRAPRGPDSIPARRALIDAWGHAAARAPEIRALAGLALHEAGHPADRAERIRAVEAWVRRNVSYAREVGEILETPVWVARHRVADCDGMTGLVLAMGRAIGLTGRACLLFRAVEDAEAKERLTAFHVFAQFYAHDSWVPADPGFPGSLIGESPGVSMLRRGLVRARPR